MLRYRGPQAPEGGGPAYFSREYNDWETQNGFPKGSVEAACRFHIGSERAHETLVFLKMNGVAVGPGGKLRYPPRLGGFNSSEGFTLAGTEARRNATRKSIARASGVRKSNATATTCTHGVQKCYVKARTNPARAAGTANSQPEDSESEERDDIPDHVRQFYARGAFTEEILANHQDRVPPPPQTTEQAPANRSGRGPQRVSSTQRPSRTPPSRPVRTRVVRFAPEPPRTPGHQTQHGDLDEPPPGTPPPRYHDVMSYSPPRYTRNSSRSPPGTPTPAYNLYPEFGHTSERQHWTALPEPEPRAPTFPGSNWPGSSPQRPNNRGSPVRGPQRGRPATPGAVRRVPEPEPESEPEPVPEPMDIDWGYSARENQAYIQPIPGIGLQRRNAVRDRQRGRAAAPEVVRRRPSTPQPVRRRPEPEPEADSWDDTELVLRSGPVEGDAASQPGYTIDFTRRPELVRGPDWRTPLVRNPAHAQPATQPAQPRDFFSQATGGLFTNNPGQPSDRRSSIGQTPPPSSYQPRGSGNTPPSPTPRRNGRSQRRSQR